MLVAEDIHKVAAGHTKTNIYWRSVPKALYFGVQHGAANGVDHGNRKFDMSSICNWVLLCKLLLYFNEEVFVHCVVPFYELNFIFGNGLQNLSLWTVARVLTKWDSPCTGTTTPGVGVSVCLSSGRNLHPVLIWKREFRESWWSTAAEKERCLTSFLSDMSEPGWKWEYLTDYPWNIGPTSSSCVLKQWWIRKAIWWKFQILPTISSTQGSPPMHQ